MQRFVRIYDILSTLKQTKLDDIEALRNVTIVRPLNSYIGLVGFCENNLNNKKFKKINLRFRKPKNLSYRKPKNLLSETEEFVLSHGLNFCLPPKNKSIYNRNIHIFCFINSANADDLQEKKSCRRLW